MPGIVIAGWEVDVRNRTVTNFNDDPRLKAAREDGYARPSTWVRQVILHTTKGKVGDVIETPGPNLGKEFDVAKYWSGSKKSSGTQLVVDTDGSIGCLADLRKWASFHAGNRGINQTSIGIELYQILKNGKYSIYRDTIDGAADLCEVLAEQFGIMKQLHLPWTSSTRPARLLRGGADCTGFFGHRDVTWQRGEGDPGNQIIEELLNRGWEGFDFGSNEDIIVWKERQEWINTQGFNIVVDGVPGHTTRKALAKLGYKRGQWVHPPVIDTETDEDEDEDMTNDICPVQCNHSCALHCELS